MSPSRRKSIYRPAQLFRALGKKNGTPLGKTGFTLLELMVVLLLMALLAGVTAPSVSRFLSSLNFREQTANVLASLRYARLMAITKGQQVSVTFDDSSGKIIYFSGAVNEQKEFDIAEDASFTLEPPEITFFPEGQATPARLISEKGSKVVRYTMDPLTALPVPEPPPK